ncbi:HD family hydrolase [Flexibacterium corallicola]|uniref:HD family hydrolase n=1 Tax=Flexibacterium corallicola TaxID=3037259 RepID=UPI00286F23F2|nr:HD family hydrolase [Pseudovibrio sp. M1P-2-3]
MSSGQKRAWQRMLSGRRLDLLEPSALDIEIEDIAHGLARVARWNGQTVGAHAFSVAQHSIIVEQILCFLKPDIENNWRLAALLHDAPEYVIGDMISPFKTVLGESYKGVEERIHSAVHQRFSLPHPLPMKISKLIKRADIISAYFEALYLAGFSKAEADTYFGTPKDLTSQQVQFIRDGIVPLSTMDAQALFLKHVSQVFEQTILRKYR